MVWAYIDPGCGSIMLQVMAGGVIGTAYVIKRFGRRIRLGLRRVFRAVRRQHKV